MELSLLFALSEYNDGGLMRQVMVGRVGGNGKGYSVWVCISMKAYFNYFYLLYYLFFHSQLVRGNFGPRTRNIILFPVQFSSCPQAF